MNSKSRYGTFQRMVNIVFLSLSLHQADKEKGNFSKTWPYLPKHNLLVVLLTRGAADLMKLANALYPSFVQRHMLLLFLLLLLLFLLLLLLLLLLL